MVEPIVETENCSVKTQEGIICFLHRDVRKIVSDRWSGGANGLSGGMVPGRCATRQAKQECKETEYREIHEWEAAGAASFVSRVRMTAGAPPF